MKIIRFFFPLSILVLLILTSDCFSRSQKSDGVLEIYKDSLLLSKATYSHWKDTVWQKNTQISYSYDEKGNLLEMLWIYWDPVVMHYFKKTDYSYNDENLLRTELKSNWQSDQWQNQSRTEYAYDYERNKSEAAFNTWIFDSYSWLWYWWCDNKTLYSYSEGLLVSETNIKRSGVDYVNDTRHLYSYQPNKLISADLAQDYSDSTWQDQLRTTFTYDNKNRMQLIKVFYTLDSVWSQKSCDSSWYNNSGLTAGHVLWDIQSGDAVFKKELYSYDTNNLRSLSVAYDLTDTVWKPVQMSEYSYNGANIIEKIIYYTWNGSAWVLYNKDEFEYWKVRTGVVEAGQTSKCGFTVIPDRNNILHIKTDGIGPGAYPADIFDINGRCVFSGSVSIGNDGDADVFARAILMGVNIFRLRTRNGDLTQKFLAQ